MELELGLGISNCSPKVPILKELDLISYVSGETKQFYDDGSCLSSQNSVNYDDDDDDDEDSYGVFCMKKKRGFCEAFEVESPKTLPLLLWDKEPNEQDKHPKRLCQFISLSFPKNDGEGIVGWPPIKSYRKKLRQRDRSHRHFRRHIGNFPAENGGGCGGFRSMFVKVQIEGFGITRKIDLKLYHSYESLTSSLLTMFGKGQDNVNGYKLTYQDREGDWLLAGDLPWRTFTGLVQRLKLIKRED